MVVFLLTLLHFVVTPMTLASMYSRFKKQSKRVKRNLKRRYRRVRKFGVFGQPSKREAEGVVYQRQADFITDKMLSSSEDEQTNEAGSYNRYISPNSFSGIFTA